MSVPLILTLILQEEVVSYLTSLRNKYFPADRNYLKAHLTLFHHLPDSSEIHQDLEEICRRSSFSVKTKGLLSLGNGFAVKIESTELQALQRLLQQKWWLHLTHQDRQKLRPHITIQNKVSPEIARSCMLEAAVQFKDLTISTEGLALWEYRNGPWNLKKEFKWI